MFLSDLRAEAQRRWQEPSSRPLLLDGPGAELLHKGEEVGHAPVLGDLAVAHAHDINGLELNLRPVGTTPRNSPRCVPW